jgi:PAS domain S-box-containing protein
MVVYTSAGTRLGNTATVSRGPPPVIAPPTQTAGFDSGLLRAMVDNAADGIIAIDERGRVHMMNPAGERLFGYSRAEVLGRNVSMLMPEPYRSQHDHYLRRYLETGERRIMGVGREVEGRRKDGSTFPMYLSVAEVVQGTDRFFTGIVHDLTASRAAENRIAELQRQEETILTAVGEGILQLDRDGMITFANPAAGQMLGCPRESLIGLSIHDVWQHAEDVICPPLRAIMQGESSKADGALFRRCDHSLFPVGFVTTPIWQNDVPAGAVISFQDITDRQRAQEELRRERDKVESYLQIAGAVIVALDAQGNVSLINRKGCELLGCTADHIVGKNWFDNCLPPSIRDETRGLFRQMIAGEGEFVAYHENPIRCRDGRERLIAWHNAALMGADGVTIGTLSSGDDITERRRATQELDRMRTYLKNIIDSMPSILVGVDIQGRVTEWNRGAEEATGIPAAEANGRLFGDLLPQLRSQARKVRQALRKGTPIRTERLTEKLNGETRYLDVVVYPLVAGQTSVGAAIRVDDVTNRVRIDQMMVQTEKMMSVGGLAAGMAHEINNPLSAVLQSSQNILRRLSDDLPANQKAAHSLGLDLERVRRYLDRRGILHFIEGIQEAAGRATRIVADMLSFSRRSDTQFTPADLNELLDTVLRLAGSDYDLKKKYDFRQIEVVREYDPELPAVTCDRTEIEQVFLNIIKNAAQAMATFGSQPYRLTLRTRRRNNYVSVEIEDNGPGMDPSIQDRIFEPFYTTKPVGLGTGLGLSVSYFIVTEQHHGTLTVKSTPAMGTCFVVTLPVRSRGPE